MEENKCVLCDAEFKPGYLDENSICGTCNKEFPGAKTKEDMKKKKKPEVESHEAFIKELVTKQVNELLESFGIIERCLECGNFYYRKSPAQKRCPVCKESKTNEKV